ncbi:hypothetical protein K7432_007158 [Basidiobolus ranarum]|uniref:Uncharacterized protein n=1 Tax=Basidiobolus ranarum TaxID=34480 RepID=A0ABR2WTW6_9FUNG
MKFTVFALALISSTNSVFAADGCIGFAITSPKSCSKEFKLGAGTPQTIKWALGDSCVEKIVNVELVSKVESDGASSSRSIVLQNEAIPSKDGQTVVQLPKDFIPNVDHVFEVRGVTKDGQICKAESRKFTICEQ